MAYTHKGPGPNGCSVYNVEQPVGKGAVNAGSDVKLVQYLIRDIYGAQAAGVAVDGYIGPVTVSWIERYQKDAKARGVNVLVDARIDRALGRRGFVGLQDLLHDSRHEPATENSQPRRLCELTFACATERESESESVQPGR